MFVEVSGSTRLHKRLGDEIADRCVGECLDTLTVVVESNDGTIIKTNGDGLTCHFDSAATAIAAAQTAQRNIAALRPHGDTRMAIRIGIHYGEAMTKNNSLFGDAVNLAARMMGIAQGGQIVTTGDTIEQLPNQLHQDAEKIDGTRVISQQREIDVFQVYWQTEAAADAIQANGNPISMQLNLSYASTHCEINTENPTISIGRGRSCDLMVDVSEASREHARCELRDGKFILRDQSTNGTYIKLEEGDNEIHLHSEEMELHGQGLISLGRPVTGCNTEMLLYYRC